MTTETTGKTLKQLARAVAISCTFGAKLEWDQQDEWQRNAIGWHCTLRYKGRQYSFDFWLGRALTGEPTAEGCLECLLSDAQSGELDFEGFCGELDFDPDSRKAERTWQACYRVAANMRRLLGEDYERFLYAERD